LAAALELLAASDHGDQGSGRGGAHTGQLHQARGASKCRRILG
jgi:hypothetical protein